MTTDFTPRVSRMKRRSESHCSLLDPTIPKNQISDSLVELIDLNPTICELAGVPVLPRIDAKSIAPVLHGETETHHTETVSALQNFRCIRTATHKLIENYNDVTELYDLENDPSELHNIAESEREIARTLSGRLASRFRSELVFLNLPYGWGFRGNQEAE